MVAVLLRGGADGEDVIDDESERPRTEQPERDGDERQCDRHEGGPEKGPVVGERAAVDGHLRDEKPEEQEWQRFFRPCSGADPVERCDREAREPPLVARLRSIYLWVSAFARVYGSSRHFMSFVALWKGIGGHPCKA